ncbi:hypothetical protein [Streptomyces johnsoniae]|uniref:Serine/threonine protein kinase n=1 Tax=Streptomyces johnsoniae TaxID=3075532 RepID=A0ABU2RY97_9ACTN|nr:hypothetical protein [Streptomyces sp. DSM 41886]MDT0441592.1 hypothetical protein [Streptomyces sp. DSM 41886]
MRVPRQLSHVADGHRLVDPPGGRRPVPTAPGRRWPRRLALAAAALVLVVAGTGWAILHRAGADAPAPAVPADTPADGSARAPADGSAREGRTHPVPELR